MSTPTIIGDCALYLGDSEELLYKWDHELIDAVVSDPYYGKSWNVDATRFTGGASRRSRRRAWKEPIKNDDKPFDPTPWLGFDQVILWGSNCYPTPDGTALVWVKRNPKAFGTFLSDAEVAYKKGGHGVYCYLDVSFTGAGQNFEKRHPHEKPLGLMEWCVGMTKGRVLDPYMGSGTTGVACVRMGRPFIGVELDKKWFDIACERISQAQKQPSLFEYRPTQRSLL